MRPPWFSCPHVWHRRRAFLIIDEPRRYTAVDESPRLTLEVTLGGARSAGLDGWTMAGVHHDGITQTDIRALNVLWGPPRSPQLLATTDRFTVSTVALFLRCQSWNPTARGLLRLALLGFA